MNYSLSLHRLILNRTDYEKDSYNDNDALVCGQHSKCTAEIFRN